MEQKEFCDMSYAKKNKNLCVYCSYREAVPSKNKLFCSELCRLLHYSLSKKEIDLDDINKLIKLPKIDLIQMILNLKCQNHNKDDLCKTLNKKLKEKPFSVKKEIKSVKLNFD